MNIILCFKKDFVKHILSTNKTKTIKDRFLYPTLCNTTLKDVKELISWIHDELK
jgi:hypothetical protein